MTVYSRRQPILAGATSALAMLAIVMPGESFAQTSSRDVIAEWLSRAKPTDQQVAQASPQAPKSGSVSKTIPQAAPPVAPAPEPVERDPREGELAYEQARKLMAAIDAVLQDTAKNRGEVNKLPSKDDFLVTPIWTETKEDREKKIRDLLDAALGIVTDVPVVDFQKRVEERRKSIREIDERIIKLREKQMAAPKDGMLPGVLTDTVDSLAKDIDEAKKKIEFNREDIKAAKADIAAAMAKSGVQLTPEQVDMLLDSVLSGDLVRLVAVFNSAKIVDAQLGKLMTASGDNTNAARKYFAMHAALFAMLVHAQDSLIAKIDTNYLPKLEAITKDVDVARRKTTELLRAENRPDQKKALEANRESQKLAEEAAKGYRRYMLQQREQIASARKRAAHDLRIADNTFETVEASFQLQ